MKVIDLLNMISKGEEVPKKIEYHGIIYELEIYGGWKYYIDRVNSRTLLDRINSVANLNCEIKIIEEDKKIEKLDRELNCDDDTIRGLVASVNEIYKEIADKINEIIDKLNEEEK